MSSVVTLDLDAVNITENNSSFENVYHIQEHAFHNFMEWYLVIIQNFGEIKIS
jgi:hypothetical protein